jgi:DNA mismatch repair ATPase MutS
MRKVIIINPELIMVESPGSLLFFSVNKKTIKKIHMSSTHCSDNCDTIVLNNGTVCNTDPRCGVVFSDLTTTHTLPHNTFEDSREFPLLTRISKDEVLLVRQRRKRFDLFCIIDTKEKQVTKTFETKSIFGIRNAVEMGIGLCQGVVAFACADNNIRIVDIDQVRVLSSSNNSVDVTIRGIKRIGLETIMTVTDIGFRIYKILTNNKQQDSLLNHLLHNKWCDISVSTSIKHDC